MDLGSPISSVIPSAHGPVLAVLARAGVPLSPPRVAELTGGRISRRAAHNSLVALTAAGLALMTRAPRAHLYSLNPEHVAYPAVMALARLRDELLARMRSDLEYWQVPAGAVWLYGSAARSDGGAGSDIDVLVVRPDDVDVEDPRWSAQLDSFTENVRSWSGNRAELLEVTWQELEAMHSRGEPLVDALIRDALILAGAGPDRLRTPNTRMP